MTYYYHDYTGEACATLSRETGLGWIFSPRVGMVFLFRTAKKFRFPDGRRCRGYVEERDEIISARIDSVDHVGMRRSVVINERPLNDYIEAAAIFNSLEGGLGGMAAMKAFDARL
jgi:hypothetical protein